MSTEINVTLAINPKEHRLIMYIGCVEVHTSELNTVSRGCIGSLESMANEAFKQGMIAANREIIRKLTAK